MRERCELALCFYMEKSSSEALSAHRVWAEVCPLIWHELIFHPARSEGLSGALSPFSTRSCATQPTLFGKELKHHSPPQRHKSAFCCSVDHCWFARKHLVGGLKLKLQQVCSVTNLTSPTWLVLFALRFQLNETRMLYFKRK